MIPVPPPLRLEFGTGVSGVPLNVTETMFASVVVAYSMATPTTSTRSVPPPITCDHERDVRPVAVVAARLAASKVMADAVEGLAATINPASTVAVRAIRERSVGMFFPLLAALRLDT